MYHTKPKIMQEERKWRLVATKPKAEKKVCELLTKKNIEHYCATTRIYKTWSNRFKMITSPLFERYVFVLIAQDQEIMIQKIDGVQNFIYWHMQPAIIKSEEIALMKTFTSQHSNVVVERATVNINEDASLIFADQPYEDVDAAGPKKQVCKAYLPSLGYVLVAEAPKWNVEVINVGQQKYAQRGKFSVSFK